MIKPEVQKYIQEQLAQGVSRDIITDSLSKTGWDKKDIEDSLSAQSFSLIDEKIYPIQFSWVFKSWIKFFLALVVSLILLFFGLINYYLILVIVYTPIHFFILILRRKNFHYVLDSKFMIISQGVLNKQQRNIPYGVIQNVFVKQDVFDRMFGLASLTIENAAQGGGAQKQSKFLGMPISNTQKKDSETIGFDGNQISIPGLKKEDAELLKTEILARMKANPIDDNRSGL